jgi:tetratricopeptide (TPR) repeat protein
MASKSLDYTQPAAYNEDLLSLCSENELASSYMEQGELSLLKGDVSGIELLDKAAELDPCNHCLFYRQGLALFEYGSVAGKEKSLLLAAKKFKIAANLKPDYFDAWHAWGNALSLLGLTYEEHHYFIEAEEKLKKALFFSDHKTSDLLAELYWDYAVVWMRISNQSGEAVDLQKALLAFEKSSSYQELMPQEFWNDYGLAALSMADRINDIRLVVKAINCFRHAVSLTLSFFDGWILLARSMSRLYTHTHDEDHFTQTHECFSAAAHLKPASLDLWHEWAVFLLEAGRRTQDMKRLRVALEKCQRGHAFDPKHPLLLATWAEILATMGEHTDRIDLIGEAQNKISEALDISNEEDAEVWHSYGKCLYSFGGYFHDLDYYYQAIEKFQEGVALDRTRHQDWYAIAQVFATVGKIDNDIDAFEKAVRFYTKALDLKPIGTYYYEYAFALSRLGDLKRDQNLLEQAITYFEYTLQVQKNGLYIHPEWLFHYAATLDQLGDVKDDETLHQKALEIFSQVLVLDPDFPRLHYHIGLAYSHVGEAFGEIDYFYRAIHHYRLDLKQTDENETVLLEWGTTLINIGQYTSDKDVAEQSNREAEIKLVQAARLGNEEAFYQLGCLYSLLGRHDKSLHFLQKSHKADTLPPIEDLLEDEWLDSLRLNPLFQEFIAHLQHG